MQRQIKWFSIFLIILITHLNKSYSQQQDLNVEVKVTMDQIPPAAQEKLVNFKQKVEDYLNKNKYHDEKITPIQVQMEFNFTGLDLVSSTYQAKLFIASKREVYDPFKPQAEKYSVAFRFLDERCEFYYNENLPFIKNDYRFDSFLSLLDYYAYMIVGYDEDSYWPDKRGNKFFQKALDICNKVTGSAKGWNETGGGSKPSRLQLVQEILDIRFEGFRKSYFEYMWTGMDSLTINKDHAFKNILDAIESISNIKKKEVKSFNIDIFFDSKANEIAETFIDYGNRSVYDKLIDFDRSHQSIYEEARKRAR
ncbi:MAG: DUF4835 family protein [Ignavibacteria bacterium]